GGPACPPRRPAGLRHLFDAAGRERGQRRGLRGGLSRVPAAAGRGGAGDAAADPPGPRAAGGAGRRPPPAPVAGEQRRRRLLRRPLRARAMRLERFGELGVLPVMAAPPEYGPHLRARISPLMTGIGPVEAAVALARALARLEGEGALPDLIVSLGSCGSRVLEHAAVYQASSVSYRDMDASALGFPRGVTPLLDEPAVLPLLCPVPDLPTARLSTGANVVSGAGYDAIDAEMADMETWALVRAARVFGVPLVALRGVSDGRSELE